MLSHLHITMVKSSFPVDVPSGMFCLSQRQMNELKIFSQSIQQFNHERFEPSDKAMCITFQYYKLSSGRPHTILVHVPSDSHYPVAHLRMCLVYRGTSSGPLFILPSGRPVLRETFLNTMNKSLHFLGIHFSLYKTQSFRIRIASYATQNGMHYAQIRYMGRRKSDTFLSYIQLV